MQGDKVAQLVRCRTCNQLVTGSIPGRGTLVCSQSTQLQNGYLALIRQCLELVHYMLPAALEYPLGIEMVSVCTGLLGEEGRLSTSVDTRL